MASTNSLITKLGIGTVQFGLDYGISNSAGKTKLEDITAILQHASDNAITIIDTAHGYGDSEKVLGQTLPHDRNTFKIVTKTPSFADIETQAEAVAKLQSAFENSLENIKQKALYGLMFHHADDLFGTHADALYNAMCDLKNGGLVKKIGVSAYHQDQIERIIARFDIDIIQVPVNIFDQRLIRTGMLQALKEKVIKIHARSAFLQGLFFMSPQKLPQSL
ncbi:MAG: aldo/keto reductase [Pseudomonadota bacterium]